ncbi:MAG: GTP-binding protein [Lachnospiraceae bacterium]|nr:GTP-binding protein [Lachnospiraceae bacterium]
MTKIDIFSGFLGAGKTTLIKKLLKESLSGEKVVLIENEFGEIGIDGGFLKEAGIEITEMNSGCICCSLVGDFGIALNKVLDQFHPDRILIEPSDVGKLSDVIKAVDKVADAHEDAEMGAFVTVVDAKKCKMYMKNFGEFFNDQIEYATTILLSRTQDISEEKLAEVCAMVTEHNAKARIVTTPWDDLTGAQILAVMQQQKSLADEMMEEHEHLHFHDGDDDDEVCPVCGGHHHHHDDDDDDDHECCHHHHHDDDDDDDHECCHHHHHDDDDDDDDHECCHHHDHDHDHEHEHHHHHHHADEVFTSWGVETPKKFTKEELASILDTLSNDESLGFVLRAKGMVPSADGTWMHFDMTPGESEIRNGSAEYTGRLCVIGSKLDEDKLKDLFGI